MLVITHIFLEKPPMHADFNPNQPNFGYKDDF